MRAAAFQRDRRRRDLPGVAGRRAMIDAPVGSDETLSVAPSSDAGAASGDFGAARRRRCRRRGGRGLRAASERSGTRRARRRRPRPRPQRESSTWAFRRRRGRRRGCRARRRCCSCDPAGRLRALELADLGRRREPRFVERRAFARRSSACRIHCSSLPARRRWQTARRDLSPARDSPRRRAAPAGPAPAIRSASADRRGSSRSSPSADRDSNGLLAREQLVEDDAGREDVGRGRPHRRCPTPAPATCTTRCRARRPGASASDVASFAIAEVEQLHACRRCSRKTFAGLTSRCTTPCSCA